MSLVRARWTQGMFLCVGLDTDPTNIIPSSFMPGEETWRRMYMFNKQVVEATKSLAAAYKINLQFYLAQGMEGLRALLETCQTIREQAPEVPVILDAKFGDIGKTNDQSARFAFAECQADAVTVSPYVGQEGLQPFLRYPDKGVIVLARTSNAGADEFQNLITITLDPRQKPYGMGADEWLDQLCEDPMPLYARVARHVATRWNVNDNCMVVVGATAPLEAKEIRQLVPDLPFLVPGIGTQGGDIEKTVIATRDGGKEGILINVSSSLSTAGEGQMKGTSKAIRAEAQRLHNTINTHRIAA